MKRYAIGNLVESIDYMDPCSRQRQIPSIEFLRARHESKRILRAVAMPIFLLGALLLATLVAAV